MFLSFRKKVFVILCEIKSKLILPDKNVGIPEIVSV